MTTTYYPDYSSIADYFIAHGNGCSTYVDESNGVYFSVTADLFTEYHSTQYSYDTPPEHSLTDFYFNVEDVECYDTETGDNINCQFDNKELYNTLYQMCN